MSDMFGGGMSGHGMGGMGGMGGIDPEILLNMMGGGGRAGGGFRGFPGGAHFNFTTSGPGGPRSSGHGGFSPGFGGF